MADDSTAKDASRQVAVRRFREYLDALDAQITLPGEPPLREAVAQQAQERLAEMPQKGDSAQN